MNRATGVITFEKAARLSGLLMGASRETRDKAEQRSWLLLFATNFADGFMKKDLPWASYPVTEPNWNWDHARIFPTFPEGEVVYAGAAADKTITATWVERTTGVAICLRRRDDKTFSLSVVGYAADEVHYGIFERYVDPAHEKSISWPRPHVIGGDASSLEDTGRILIAGVIRPAQECLDRVHRSLDSVKP